MTYTPFFSHKQFLTDNNIDIKTLPKSLQQRIIGFEELEEQLKNTVNDDKYRFIGKLEDLSHELDEDLEDHFEADLQHNYDHDDEEGEVKPHAPAHECACKKKAAFAATTVPYANENRKSQETVQPDLNYTGDELIIKNLYDTNVRTVAPVALINKGFKTPFHSREIRLGHFLLKRKRFHTSYEIYKLN